MKKTLLSLSFFASALLLAQAPTNGLVGYYGFEGNGNSHNQQHNFTAPSGTETPSATYENGGKIGKGVLFSGDQALINTTLNDVFSTNTPITISYWYKDTESVQNTYGTQVEFFGSFLCRYQGALKAEINTTGGYINVDSQYTYPELATWRHVTITYDPGNNIPLALWINANRLPIQASAGRLQKPFIKAVIGNGLASNGNLHMQKGYIGMIDEMFVYNRVLTASEIESVMFNTQAITPPILSAISSVNVNNTRAGVSYTVNAQNETATSEVRYGTSPTALTGIVLGEPTTGNVNTPQTITITGLTANTTYYYTVSATNASGTTTSSVNSFTTTNSTAPEVPIIFVNNISFGSARINYFISPNTNTTVSYYLEYGTAPDQLNQRTDVTETIATQQFTTSTLIYGLTEQTVYYYRVVASSVNGIGYSDLGTFRTTAAPISIYIDPVTVTDITDTTATVNYSLNQGIGETSVILSYGTSETDQQEVNVPGSNGNAVTNTYTITNLQPGTDYYCSLRATNGQTIGYSLYSYFTTGTLSSGVVNKLIVNLLPNPATDVIQITANQLIKEIRIYNLQGQQVLAASESTINISALQSGAYIIKVTDAANNTMQTKLIKK
ncbi:MAG: fibronectin type III domain-containing protein [Flavobacterium sp.]